jgi:predicted nucleic acid-binding protein
MSLTLDTFRPAAVVATDVCFDLALGRPEALAFFDAPPVDIRLATATYLELLEGCRNPEEQRRVKRFVQGYAVLSLGPMASSNAVQLLLEHSLADGLTAVQALAAATALAHEIPLVTARPEPYRGIAGLEVMTPYVG